MGACLSTPEADKQPAKAASKNASHHGSHHHGHHGGGGGGAAAKAAAAAPKVPDFGLAEFWEVIKLLGTGGEGETWLCKEKATGRHVAIKLVKRPIPKSITQIIQREIRILADLGDGHLNIVHAEEVVLSRTHVGLVMEFVQGGNMVGYVTRMRETREARGGLCLDEDESNYYFRQLIWAVQFCHNNHVAHRDLKLDNTLLDGHDPPRLKLCDFGFAKGWGASSNMDTMRIGTPEYMGPELISGRSGYDGKKVDVWASGVLLFVLLLGMFPFEMEDENYVNTAGLYSIWIQQIRTSWQDNPHNATGVGRLSADCRDLLDRMFDVNQDTRISVDQIVKHPWFSRPLPPRYADALARLQQEQAAITGRFAASNFRSKERDAQLLQLLERATRAPEPDEGVVRVALARTRDALAALPPIDTGIGTIAEGGGGGGGTCGGNGGGGNGGGGESHSPSRAHSQSQL